MKKGTFGCIPLQHASFSEPGLFILSLISSCLSCDSYHYITWETYGNKLVEGNADILRLYETPPPNRLIRTTTHPWYPELSMCMSTRELNWGLSGPTCYAVWLTLCHWHHNRLLPYATAFCFKGGLKNLSKKTQLLEWYFTNVPPVPSGPGLFLSLTQTRDLYTFSSLILQPASPFLIEHGLLFITR